jgi:hypothetical protein
VKVLGQAPVTVVGVIVAATPVTRNVEGLGCAGLTVVVADLKTVPAELVALKVYTVDVEGDIAMDPEALTRPMPWSILTELAPVTFHDKFDVPPALIADGLLLKVPITEGWAAGACIVTQLGMRISSVSSDKERNTNFFNEITSKILLLAT